MIKVYTAATMVAGPLAKLIMWHRARNGKEDSRRIGERFGRASRPRPIGPIIWVHAASVGETISILPLVTKLLDEFRSINVLITTGTVSSAQILEKRVSKRLIHQFAPIDQPGAIKPFLNHWTPDVAIWVESELWPNLVSATQQLGILMILVQGRMSERSFRRWCWLRRLVRPLLEGFSQIMVQTPLDAEHYKALGALDPIVTGTLKYSAPPLEVDHFKLEQIRSTLGDRPCWVAASAHPGEFDMLRSVHVLLREKHPNILTIVVPRHPAAGAKIQTILLNEDISCALRSMEDEIMETTEVYIGDSLGELSIFYSLCPVAFIGGSLIPHGGQNPLEAIQLGCATVVGSYMFNFSEIISDLRSGQALLSISSAEELAIKVAELIASPVATEELWSRQKAVVSERGNTLDNVFGKMVRAFPSSIKSSGVN